MYENRKYDKSNRRKRKQTFRIENPCIEDNRGKSVRNRACHFHDIHSKVGKCVGTLTSKFNFV